MTELPFKLGRLPNDPAKPRMRYSALFAGGVVPAPAPACDYTTKVKSFPMFLNDQIGDCTTAAAGHMIEVWTAEVTTEALVTDDDVLNAYIAVSGYNPQTGANDDGAVMQDVLNFWRKSGVASHKILAFAEIDVHNLDAVRHAIETFGQVYLGMNFPNSAMDQFNAGKPWDYNPSANNTIEGGHCIPCGQYDTAKGKFTVVTWGDRQDMTTAFWDRYVEECWVPVTQDWIDGNGLAGSGVSIAALSAEYTRLTKQPSPFPDSPVPVPVEPPADVDTDLAAALTRYLKTSHVPKYISTAAKAWLDAR